MARGGFRAFLGLPAKQAEPKLTELAKLEPEPGPTPVRPFADTNRNDATAPRSSADTDKTAEQISEPAEQISANPRKKSARRPSYVWLSQKTRDARAPWADYVNRPFY